MSDDTATVEQIKELVLDYAGAVESMEMATGPEFQVECDRAEAALMSAIEQQARTIAELQSMYLAAHEAGQLLAGNLADRDKTISEQAARLGDLEHRVSAYEAWMNPSEPMQAIAEYNAAIDGAKT